MLQHPPAPTCLYGLEFYWFYVHTPSMISLATHLLHEFGVEIVIISHVGSQCRIMYHNKLYCLHIICIVESEYS